MNTVPPESKNDPSTARAVSAANCDAANFGGSPGGSCAAVADEESVEPRAPKSWMSRIGGLVRNDLVHNTAALYGVQLCRKIFPLITMPYLARVLGPSVWGTVAFVSSLGEFIVLIIEFGFNLSATRQIAQARNSPMTCANVMAGVIGAQAVLATLSVVAAWFAAQFIPLLRDNPQLLWAGVFYGVCQGVNPLWFFQGLERLRLLAALEITGKTIGVIGVFLIVRSPENAWLALLLQGIPPLLSAIVGLAIAYRLFPFVLPTASLVKDALTTSWRLFVFRSGESLYGAGNAFILGLFAPAASVGYFAIAEKISKAAFGLLNPVREALYPRLSRLAAGSAGAAARLARIGAALMISGGLLLGIGLYVFAPLMIRTITGSNFAPAVTVLRIFALLPPLLSVTYSVGMQWLLPHGHDGVVNRIILSAGAVNLAMAFLAAPHFQHIGMAVSVLIAECFVCASMVQAVMVRTPFWARRKPESALATRLGEEVMNG
jgi:PST family polysaccharide transporter